VPAAPRSVRFWCFKTACAFSTRAGNLIGSKRSLTFITTCTPCTHRAQCTRAKKEPRLLGLQAREQYEALQAARQRRATDAFAQQYAPRAGIESTQAQRIRRCGLRQARYRGLARTHLQHLATAAALNVVRLGEWFAGTPRAKTRCSPFAALKAA
jgi:transposase